MGKGSWIGSPMQERQRKGVDWKPRWFVPATDTTVYPYEATEKECPMWEFTGTYYNQERSAANGDGELSKAQSCMNC